MDAHAISFGPFRLLAAQRLLLDACGRPVRLGGRAFDILTALVERAGEVVGKEELIARVWPQTFVEDANLKIQVSALRRALGDGQGGDRYIVTVPGRGYNFVAPVRLEEPSWASPPPKIAPAVAHNLPLAVTRIIGRDEAIAALVSRFSGQRLVTIVGAGGVGKTTVALAVAERMITGYEHGVWLVDLAPLADPRLVPSAVATVLGLEIRTEDPLHGLVAGLKDNRLLLLLDNCEHVIDAAADLTAAVLRGVPGVNVLATSREPLGAAGECEYRLGPLANPQPSSRLTGAEAGAFPAVRLFVERVTAIAEDFALTDGNASLVVEICRRLDGLPLAIEFAAPSVAALGVDGLAARLDATLPLLGTRRRSAMPRHRTMRAVIDWSHNLLSQGEQLFFRALSVFSGSFAIEAAAAVASDEGETHNATLDHLANLVAKSLVVADVGGAKPRFRLLDTTRAYAIEKLNDSGERNLIAYRHAEYYRKLFEHAEAEAATCSASEWLAEYAREIDNLRVALDWAFSPSDGDISIGIKLTAAAVSLWMYLSLVEECRVRVERALTAIGTAASGGSRLEMKLQAALGASLAWVGGATTKIESAWTTTLSLAERLGDVDHELRALWGLWLIHDRQALALAQRFAALASTPADRLISDLMIGYSYHFQGNQSSARRHIERVIANDATPDSSPRIIRFHVDQQPMGVLARILWLQGLPDQAMGMVERLVERAKTDGHANSLCHALAIAACPIVLWLGQLDPAEQYIELLLDTSSTNALPLWHALGRAHRGVLLFKRGNLGTGLSQMRAAFEECRAVPTGYRVLILVADLAEAMGRAGQTGEALATVEQDIDRAGRTAEGWIIPELVRVKGELLRLGGAPGAMDAAEACFRDAFQLAGTQDALSWELRAATSLARLQYDQNRHAEALALLQPVFDRFTEGFDTADLKAAKALLDTMSARPRPDGSARVAERPVGHPVPDRLRPADAPGRDDGEA